MTKFFVDEAILIVVDETYRPPKLRR